MNPVRLLVTGKMGSGKSFAADYLVTRHGAQRWSRTELMKRLAHAIVDHSVPPDPILETIFPEPNEREEVRSELLQYAATYMPEPGKPRRLYQDITEICQEYDPLCFERELMDRIQSAPEQGFCLIDDVRKLSAFEFFTTGGFHTLRINAPEDLRLERILQRDGYLPSEDTFAHASEVELDSVEHEFEIENSFDDLEGFYGALDDLVFTLRKAAGQETDPSEEG